ncbi:hypothetical protein ACFL60_08715, partial [Candidatus Omnitrophota bacterium]
EHMSMEGMVFRLIKEAAAENMYHINAPSLERNVFDKYSYEGITDSTLYKSPDTIKLMHNYTLGFVRLCERYLELGESTEAIRAAQAALGMTKSDLDRRILLYSILWRGNLRDECNRLLDKEIDSLPTDNPAPSLHVGMRFLHYSMNDLAASFFETIYERYPENKDIIRGYTLALYRSGSYDEALWMNERLLALSPSDPDALRNRELIRETIDGEKRQ